MEEIGGPEFPVVTDARPRERRASERSAFNAATAGWSSALGLGLGDGCTLSFPGMVGIEGLGILDCLSETSRVAVACFLRLRTSPIEDPRTPTNARRPIIQASDWIVRLT